MTKPTVEVSVEERIENDAQYLVDILHHDSEFAQKNACRDGGENMKRELKKEYIRILTSHTTALKGRMVEEAMKIVYEETDDTSNIFDWHMPRCAGHSHDPRCPVVHMTRKIKSRLETITNIT